MVQLNEALLERLDARASREGVSRSRLIRDAVARYLDQDAEALAVGQIVEGYRRVPETEDEMLTARADARALVDEEPW